MSLRTHFAYRKFAAPPYRLLAVNADLYLQSEMVRALRRLGHTVDTVPLHADDPSAMLTALLRAAVDLRPDAVLTENHAGFDSDGKIEAILNDLGIPVIVWYLDDFRFIIGDGVRHVFPLTLICTFERQHVPLLEAAGFPHVRFLPSASAFDPDAAYQPPTRVALSGATTFIGNTFESAKQRRERPVHRTLLSDLVSGGVQIAPGIDLVRTVLDRQIANFSTHDDAYQYAGFVVAHATQCYRQAMLQGVRASDLHIFGDRRWTTLNIRAQIHEGTDYATQTPSIYRGSAINLNLSSPQLLTAVNLRVFDVPAVGGFLLTDWREDLELLFDVKREVVTFSHLDQLNELIAYYEAHPSRRDSVITAAHARVQGEHLLIHRMQRVIDLARDVFGPRGSAVPLPSLAGRSGESTPELA